MATAQIIYLFAFQTQLASGKCTPLKTARPLGLGRAQGSGHSPVSPAQSSTGRGDLEGASPALLSPEETLGQDTQQAMAISGHLTPHKQSSESLLTVLQGPLNVACLLTHSVKISIQGGHKEQRFWDSHCAASEPLRAET